MTIWVFGHAGFIGSECVVLGAKPAISTGSPSRGDTVIDCAWSAPYESYKTSADNIASAEAAVLRHNMWLGKGIRVVGCGTCAEYMPGQNMHEGSALSANNIYSRSKLRVWLNSCHNPLFTWARIFHPIGPSQAKNRFFPTIVRDLMAGELVVHNAHSVRSFIDVRDVAGALMFLAGDDLFHGLKVYNLGGPGMRIGDLAFLVSKQINGSWVRMADEQVSPCHYGANSVMLKARGFSPKYHIEDTIGHFLEVSK